MTNQGVTLQRLEELVAKIDDKMSQQQKEEAATAMGLMASSPTSSRGRGGYKGGKGKGKEKKGESSKSGGGSLAQAATVIGAMATGKDPILPKEDDVVPRQMDELSVKSEALQAALDEEIEARRALEDELNSLKLAHNSLCGTVQTLVQELKVLKEGNKRQLPKSDQPTPPPGQADVVSAAALVSSTATASQDTSTQAKKVSTPVRGGLVGKGKRRGGI